VCILYLTEQMLCHRHGKDKVVLLCDFSCDLPEQQEKHIDIHRHCIHMACLHHCHVSARAYAGMPASETACCTCRMNATSSDVSWLCEESDIGRSESIVHSRSSHIVLHVFCPLRLARNQKICVTNPSQLLVFHKITHISPTVAKNAIKQNKRPN